MMTKAPKKAPAEIKAIDPAEKELAALEAVWRSLDSVQPEARSRILEFMKSKFSAEWPRSDY